MENKQKKVLKPYKETEKIKVSKHNLGKFEMLCICSGVNPTQDNFDSLLRNLLTIEIAKTGETEK